MNNAMKSEEITNEDKLEALLNNKDLSVFEAWDHKESRRIQADAWADWLISKRIWVGFITLTFRNQTPYDSAIKLFYKLVQNLNRELFGKNYTKIVHHSYFSYALGIEYQRRDVIHFHSIVDKPVNFGMIHNFWNLFAGFAWTQIPKSNEAVTRYVAKYVCKGGEIIPFFTKRDYLPKQIPLWWKDSKDAMGKKDELIIL